MAKIIGGSPIGMLSGKEGGRVFSRNKSGQYTRQYVVPINPKTIAQGRGRSAFASSSSSYHSLNASQKAAWQAYATSIFNPKIGSNIGQISGFNAYVALRQVVNSAQTIKQTVDISINGSAPGTPATFQNFAFENTPPTFQLESNIAVQAAAPPANLNIAAVTINSDGSFAATIDVGAAPTEGTDIENFIDGQGNEFGFLIQMSNANPQKGMFFSNPFLYTLGYIEQPQLDAADRTGVQNFTLTSTSNINTADYQSFPSTNDVVKVSIYSASRTGMLALLGDTEVTIS